MYAVKERMIYMRSHRQPCSEHRKRIQLVYKIDPIIAIIIATATSYSMHHYTPKTLDKIEWSTALSSLSALSGLLMTVATFIFTIFSQSNLQLTRISRKRFSNTISNIWFNIIIWSLVAAIVSIVAIPLCKISTLIVSYIFIFCIIIIIEKSIRTIYWTRYTLGLESMSESFEEPLIQSRHEEN